MGAISKGEILREGEGWKVREKAMEGLGLERNGQLCSK